MGRYDFSAQRVHQHATQLLQTKRISQPPSWYNVIGTTPPAQRLTRPPLQRPQKPGKKASLLFSPVNLSYQEDKLRWEYFNDHPWELARPRVVLESDGRDHERWDWSHSLGRGDVDRGEGSDEITRKRIAAWERKQEEQAGRPLNGEAVIQRQRWLMRNQRVGEDQEPMSEAAAYDQARKELYRARHAREIEDRVAKEEALATGAIFGPGPLEVGMQLEDAQYEAWREWAKKESAALKQLQGSAYTGNEVGDEASTEAPVEEGQAELQEVVESVPASKQGQQARGGAAVHP